MKADDPEQRLKNELIYGTSHPEAYMTKADELWDKYAAHRGNGYPTMDEPDFLAALAEYGEHVKAEAVKVCMNEHLKEPTQSSDDIAYTIAVTDCMKSISKMPLP